MQQHIRIPGDALGGDEDVEAQSASGGSDLLALPLLLVLSLFFLCVGVWDTVHEALITWSGRD